jgi:hypothetical protein
MKSPLHLAGAAVSCLVLASNAWLHAAEDSEARRIAAAIARNAAVKYFNQREFEFRESDLECEAKAVKPEENVRVSIRELHLFESRVLLAVTVDCRFQFGGKVKTGEEAVEVKGEVEIVHSISAAADFRVEDGKVVVSARASRLGLEVKLLKVEPSDLVGGRQRIKAVIRKNKEKFLRDINDWLAARQISDE